MRRLSPACTMPSKAIVLEASSTVLRVRNQAERPDDQRRGGGGVCSTDKAPRGADDCRCAGARCRGRHRVGFLRGAVGPTKGVSVHRLRVPADPLEHQGLPEAESSRMIEHTVSWLQSVEYHRAVHTSAAVLYRQTGGLCTSTVGHLEPALSSTDPPLWRGRSCPRTAVTAVWVCSRDERRTSGHTTSPTPTSLPGGDLMCRTLTTPSDRRSLVQHTQ